MFRSRRSTLVKRLWRCRLSDRNNEGQRPDDDSGSAAVASPRIQNGAAGQESPLLPPPPPQVNDDEGTQVKAVTQAMLKRLKERHLEVLVEAVEGRGGLKTDCVLLPRDSVRLASGMLVPPHVLCCQIWRWPELTGEQGLKKLPSCQSSPDDPLYVCCNPYHWSLRVPESPPPPPYYKTISAERVLLKQDNYDEETLVSMETGGTPTPLRLAEDGSSSNLSRRQFWCNIAYWEHRQRVGRLFTVFEPSVNVFQELPHGDGMCLGILQSQTDIETVRRTREKIGFGLTLSLEVDGLWMYNHSSYPIFVNSPTFDLFHSPTLIVKKVLPGYCLNIFDFELSKILKRGGGARSQLLDGPYDANSIRISFAKGWGPNYSRQFITSCPCWIEVLLSVNR